MRYDWTDSGIPFFYRIILYIWWSLSWFVFSPYSFWSFTMTIEQMQNVIMSKGYQWVEHIFNDDLPKCSIKFTLDKSPHYFTKNVMGDFGWGRFERYEAWKQAYDHITLIVPNQSKENV